MMNLLGIHLTLLIGPTVPVPPPPDLLESLQQVKVTHDDSGSSGFELTFRVGRSSPLDLIDYGILRNPLLLKPLNRVLVLVTFGVVPQVLMDGFITHQELSPGAGPGTSTLTVIGEDASVMLDQEEKSAEHPAQDETIIANKLILSYAQYGLIPVVIPPLAIDPPVPVERIPSQQATDYAYLNQMAARHGYVFFISPGPVPATSTAYWGPPPRLSVPQKALSVNLGAETNVEQISFAANSQAPTMVEGQVQDRLTNQAMPVRTLASTRVPLSSQPAWLVQQPNVRRRQFRQSGLNVAQAYGRAQGQTDASVDGVLNVTGELDALRYGALLQPRGLVGLRGAGYQHDGLYYVKRVTHTVKIGEYRQQFTLNRDGWGSLTPMVLT
ncbi:MAG TPA: hypothetical protein VGM86_07860 [Thermoanaerobaculia bacterium]|jgi:hypothetical protein